MGLFDAIARYMPADEEDTPVGTAGMFSGPSKAEVQGATNAVQDWWQWRDKRGWVPSVEDVTMGLAPMGMAAPIKAWHGSPHDFNAFSLEKLGTGEGAQAYGHGLYFAGNRGVAESYRDTLAQGPLKYDGKELPSYRTSPDPLRELSERFSDLPKAEQDALRYAVQVGGGPSQAIANAKRVLGTSPDKPSALPDIISTLEANSQRFESPGRLYEVELRPEEHQLLDWDKPLAEQPPEVRTALSQGKGRLAPDPSAIPDERIANAASPTEAEFLRHQREYLDNLNRRKASDFYQEMANYYGPAEASRMMSEAGIPGIRYLDGGSRGAGEGSHNYVMFNDADIQILRKLGLLGAALGGGYAMGGGGNEAQAQPLGSYLIGQ